MHQDEESVPSHVAAALSGALEGLSINSGSTAVAPLRGVPVAEVRQGPECSTHILIALQCTFWQKLL